MIDDFFNWESGVKGNSKIAVSGAVPTTSCCVTMRNLIDPVLWRASAARGMEPMKSYVFKVAIEPDKFEDGRDAWHASCPALKGCHTWGHSYEEAPANIREAVDLYVQDLLEAGEQIPLNQGTIELPEPAVVVNL